MVVTEPLPEQVSDQMAAGGRLLGDERTLTCMPAHRGQPNALGAVASIPVWIADRQTGRKQQ